MDGFETMVCERALAELAAGVAAWRPDVPAYGDLRNAAKELTYPGLFTLRPIERPPCELSYGCGTP